MKRIWTSARLDAFLPDALRATGVNTDRRARARVLVGFAITLGMLSVVFSPLAMIAGLRTNAAGLAMLFPAAALLLWRIRRGTSIALLGFICGAGLGAVALQGSIELGGLGAPPATWLCVFPLLVGLVAGPRVGVLAAGMGLAALTGLFIAMPGAAAIPLEVRYVDGIVMLVFVAVLMGIFDRHKRRALAELADVNARLEAEMRERERIEADLRLAQRLESVGRLAAGVAHEIATPVQFVRDTSSFVADATRDLIGVLARHRAVTQSILDDAGPECRRVLATDANALDVSSDLPYLVDEMPDALDRMTSGLARIASIVSSMRQLVHPTKQDFTEVALENEIDNTLAIAINEYRDVADVVTDYGGTPLVMCRASEIDQVVLNLIVNAAHAIRDTGTRGTITISTRRDGEFVEIGVRDTGHGIPDSIRDKIFDPFFTTKGVGAGTGQGLAIARSAVERHGGTLTFATSIGEGTEFRVRLPIIGRRSSMNLAA